MNVPSVSTWSARGHLFSSAGLALALLCSQGAPGTTPSPDPHTRPGPDSIPGSSVDPTEVDWRLLASLDYRTGEAPEKLSSLDGTTVKIPGFIVPLEDWETEVSEFLLVPYFGACVHTPPPPPNQLVYVEMAEDKRASSDGWSPVWVEGTLHIESTESVYGAVGFRLEGVRVTPYQ